MKYKQILSLILALSLLTSLLSACGEGRVENPANAPDNSAPETQGIAFDSEENTIRFGVNPGTIRTAINILADKLG